MCTCVCARIPVRKQGYTDGTDKLINGKKMKEGCYLSINVYD